MLISPLELYLDSKNYRLYTLTSLPEDIEDQSAIRSSIANNPEVDLQGMVDDLLRGGWRTIGERPVVCIENGRCVVLEGNRRTCACQMILDPNKLVDGIRIPHDIPQNVLESLSNIEVDVVQSRAIADPIISGKHINATIKWTTVSQMRFCVDKFDSGVPIDQILRDANVNKTKFTRFMREYRLLYAAASRTDAWSVSEKAILNSSNLEPDRYLRLFRSGGATYQLGIKYDAQYAISSSKYDSDTLSKILVLLARKALIEKSDPRHYVIDTRYDWIDLFYPNISRYPELLTHVRELWRLMSYVQPASEAGPEPDQPTSAPPSSGFAAPVPGPSSGGDETPTPPATPPTTPGSGGQPPRATPPPVFMENLNCRLSGAEAQGIILICDEIRRMSRANLYQQLPISSAVLTRALLEQTMKFHLKTTPHHTGRGSYWDELVPNPQPGKDPTLGKIIDHVYRTIFRSGHEIDIIPPTANMHAPRDIFDMLFQDGGALKRYTDIVIHHPHMVAASPNVLNDLCRGALVNFLNYIYSLHQNAGQRS